MTKSEKVIIFLKAQVSAFSGGITDYGTMILLTEFAGIHFTLSILISGTMGGMVNFCLNRYWAFNVTADYSGSAKEQFIKFFTVVMGSILLKSTGTYFLQRSFHLDYRIGRLLIDSLVSYGFNYPLMKLWVFRTLHAKTMLNTDEE